MADKAGEIWTKLTGSPPPQQESWKVGDKAEYYSASGGSWVDVKIIEVGEKGIQIDAKKGQWLSDKDLAGKIRTTSAPSFTVGQSMQYFSQGANKWIDCKVIESNSQGIQIDVKRGQWMTAATLEGKFRYPDGKAAKFESTVRTGEGVCSFLTVPTIVKNSDILTAEFPSLLERYQEVTEKNGVPWESFRDLYLGVFVKKSAKDKNGGKNEKKKKEYKKEDLERIFNELDTESTKEIKLDSIIKHKAFIEKEIPELVECWSDIDLNASGTISWQEFRLYFGGVEEWLEAEFDKILGMHALKERIRVFYRGVVLEKARIDLGFDVDSGETKYHMIFHGNPGTGKTTMGRIMARLLNKIEIIPTPDLKEVQVSELVAEYVGQTAPKTQKVIDEIKGGCLFVDEAYRLSRGGSGGSGGSFGQEAVEQLMQSMNEKAGEAPVMIFGGYVKPMEEFLKLNEGLYRRIPYTFDFDDYSVHELAEILVLMCKKKGYQLDEKLTEGDLALLHKVIEENTPQRARERMNGGICERIFDNAKQELDKRDNPENPTIVLTEADLTAGCKEIKPPPEDAETGGYA